MRKYDERMRTDLKKKVRPKLFYMNPPNNCKLLCDFKFSSKLHCLQSLFLLNILQCSSGVFLGGILGNQRNEIKGSKPIG